jgi:hypothetical protein
VLGPHGPDGEAAGGRAAHHRSEPLSVR